MSNPKAYLIFLTADELDATVAALETMCLQIGSEPKEQSVKTDLKAVIKKLKIEKERGI